ncbi:MAG: hypothetical protein ACFFAQ_04740 [Promethearchaeota archaeon]
MSFDKNFGPDWTGFSLDGQTNKTIYGNTTIPLPDDGLHTIQLFANNSKGLIYQSDVRYFIVDIKPSEPSEPIIHSYNLWILVGIISITSIIIISNRTKK